MALAAALTVGAAAEVIEAARDLGFFRSAEPGAGNEREIMASFFFPTSAPPKRHGQVDRSWATAASISFDSGRTVVSRAMATLSSL